MIAHVIETTVAEEWPAEPWVVDRADGVSLFQEGETDPCLMVADPNGEMSDAASKSIAKRAAACVNACTGLTYEQLENLPELLTVAVQAARAVEAYDALDPSLLDARLTRLLELARRVVAEGFSVTVPGICRVCGCTEDNACADDDGPCGWASGSARTLCTACERDEARQPKHHPIGSAVFSAVPEGDGMADLPELSPLQREALLAGNGRTLHQWKGGFCFNINGHQVSATTADELVAKKLARRDGGGTCLKLTPRGREVALTLAAEEVRSK